MNEHLQDIANVLYGHPVVYLSILDRKIVDVLVETGYVVIVAGHVRRPVHVSLCI